MTVKWDPSFKSMPAGVYGVENVAPNYLLVLSVRATEFGKETVTTTVETTISSSNEALAAKILSCREVTRKHFESNGYWTVQVEVRQVVPLR